MPKSLLIRLGDSNSPESGMDDGDSGSSVCACWFPRTRGAIANSQWLIIVANPDSPQPQVNSEWRGGWLCDTREFFQAFLFEFSRRFWLGFFQAFYIRIIPGVFFIFRRSENLQFLRKLFVWVGIFLTNMPFWTFALEKEKFDMEQPLLFIKIQGTENLFTGISSSRALLDFPCCEGFCFRFATLCTPLLLFKNSSPWILTTLHFQSHRRYTGTFFNSILFLVQVNFLFN